MLTCATATLYVGCARRAAPFAGQSERVGLEGAGRFVGPFAVSGASTPARATDGGAGAGRIAGYRVRRTTGKRWPRRVGPEMARAFRGCAVHRCVATTIHSHSHHRHHDRHSSSSNYCSHYYYYYTCDAADTAVVTAPISGCVSVAAPESAMRSKHRAGAQPRVPAISTYQKPVRAERVCTGSSGAHPAIAR